MLATTLAADQLIELRRVYRSFPKASGGDFVVLEDVDLTIRVGEIVGLLGRSGSGKSTLLRIIAGLIQPSSGNATYRGKPFEAPPKGVALVFPLRCFPGSPFWGTWNSASRRSASTPPSAASAPSPRST